MIIKNNDDNLQCMISTSVTITTTLFLLKCQPISSYTKVLMIGLFLWPSYVTGQAIYIFTLSFVLSFFAHLISAVADWMFTILAHMVWP